MNVYIRELSRELGNRGHRVDIYTRRHDPQDPRVIEINRNVRVIHLKAGRNGYMHKLDIYPQPVARGSAPLGSPAKPVLCGQLGV